MALIINGLRPLLPSKAIAAAGAVCPPGRNEAAGRERQRCSIIGCCGSMVVSMLLQLAAG
jgi:hypothetical protein